MPGWINYFFNSRISTLFAIIQWASATIGIPTVSIFAISQALSAIGYHHLFSQIDYMVITLIIIWVATLINLAGIRLSVKVAIFAVVTTFILPISILFCLALLHLSHSTIATPFSINNFSKESISGSLSLFAITMMMMVGIDFSAFFVNNVSKKGFVKGLKLSAAIAILFPVLGCGSILILENIQHLLPETALSSSLYLTLGHYHIGWLGAAILELSAVGQFGLITLSLLFGARTLFAIQSILKNKHFFKEKTKSSPSRFFIYQAIVLSLITVVFLSLKNTTAIYAYLLSIMSIAGLIRYLLLFILPLYVKKKGLKHELRFFRSKILLKLTVFTGLISSLLGIVFILARDIKSDTTPLLITLAVIILIIFFYLIRKRYRTQKPKLINVKIDQTSPSGARAIWLINLFYQIAFSSFLNSLSLFFFTETHSLIFSLSKALSFISLSALSSVVFGFCVNRFINYKSIVFLGDKATSVL
jgi:amino acid transporter